MDRVSAHNEVSRIFAEHGIIGAFTLLLTFTIPIFLFFRKKSNIFVLPMMAFWFLTINHSAMRVAAPGFIYGLGLINIVRRNPAPVLEKNNNTSTSIKTSALKASFQ
jgi:hypothetical protein